MSSFASSYDDRLEPESSRPSSPTLSGAGTEIDLREQYGRRVTALGRTYGLPGDSEEWYRLDRQHRMFIEMQGGKWYPPAMERVMKSNIQGEKRVLDLGCGNGAWYVLIDRARDVGLHFPLCDVLAIDLIPIKDTRYLPSNVKSEVDDIDREDGLSHLYGQFDVVHCRLVASGVRDYYELIERIVRILRPGGIMELQEFDFRIYDRDHREIEVSVYSPLGPPYWARFMAHMNQAIQKKGGDVDAARHLWKWVTSHEAFEDITYRDVWVPCIPGDDSRYAAEVYPILRENITAFLKSGRPMLLANGMSEAVYDTIEQNTLREMHESNEPQYTRLQCIYATKRHVVGEDSF
ncbi:S-adenosyl-L-methionine-dependent methyltransferase [Ephemerocybe angulata]|uniref:S-adenosyl-L-methionine-dependent methyltransferase n=1 Tax=Ephemerocybe angulata TaxID=980116 RepID=A0A8H6M610_9AGAR|nr:S-adenosyl-L-methionine-dependent methyltransferase [Tulosesus angulatus]